MQERKTEQKKIVLDALKQADHPTASELYDMVKKDIPHISKSTVFRILSNAVSAGQIKKIEPLGDCARYDAHIAARHAHMHCIKCGKVFDAASGDIERIMGLKDMDGFEISSVDIEISGICKDCKGKKT